MAEGYKAETAGAKRYFAQMLGGSRKALAVDVGWAGSCSFNAGVVEGNEGKIVNSQL